MLKRISLFAILAIIIASCSSEETAEPREIEEYVSAVMKGNNDIIVFGNVGIKGIIDKTDYKSEQMLAGLIGDELNHLNTVIDIDSPVHYAVEGPISIDGKPKRVLLFMKVKDADALALDLEKERSFLVEETGDIRYAEDDEFVIGFRDDLAIAIIQQGEYDTKKIVNEVFKKSEGDVTGGKIDEMLKGKGDLVMNLNLEHLYATSNTDLNKLSTAKQKDLKKMVKGSFVQSILKFEKGEMSLEAKNYFSKELQDLMFFKTNSSSDLATKLAKGNGKVIGGLSMNVDVKKMEHFYKTYAPEMMEDMNDEVQGMGGVFQYMGAGNIMSSLSDGEVGMLAIVNEENGKSGVGIRSYFGVPEAGQKVFSLMRNEMDLPEDGEFNYVDGGIEGIVPIDGSSINLIKGDRKLAMPKGSENFGKKGLCGFIDFDQVPRDQLGTLSSPYVDMLDYATIEVDNNGGKIYIKTKNGNDNILKQAMKATMSMLPMLMGGGMPF